jgi:hypothetical protein
VLLNIKRYMHCAAYAQVFRRRDAEKLKDAQGKPVYRLSDFGVHVSELSAPAASAVKGQQRLHPKGVCCISSHHWWHVRQNTHCAVQARRGCHAAYVR